MHTFAKLAIPVSAFGLVSPALAAPVNSTATSDLAARTPAKLGCDEYNGKKRERTKSRSISVRLTLHLVFAFSPFSVSPFPYRYHSPPAQAPLK
ncbi:hypothetical protein AG1IA_02024 [Rhizoctonia solani AG-1 IA]|uniref:Uncharacterized protein n=1 Tax=Thanatephorus cucumeris (strain AG1-IA) TaxID=983506 RepID=L8X139_THACA|nr:hypothetical protein AG1IA_02024 [Rhizoctonia solani AG-1 IA]